MPCGVLLAFNSVFITVGWRFFQFSLLAAENPIFLWKLPISEGKEFTRGGYHLL